MLDKNYDSQTMGGQISHMMKIRSKVLQKSSQSMKKNSSTICYSP